MSEATVQRDYFEKITTIILETRKKNEHFFITLTGEDTQFIRLNGSKVRQIGTVSDATLEVTLLMEDFQEGKTALRRGTCSFTITGSLAHDQEVIAASLQRLRSEVPQLPVDPYAHLPANHGSGSTETRGDLLPRESAVEALLTPTVRSMDLAGIYAAGPVVRGMSNSEGQRLWFSNETMTFDYSVYTPSQRAIKGTFGGKSWSAEAFALEMQDVQQRLPILEKPVKKLSKGTYRAYLAPAALRDIVSMFSWGCISEAAIQQGDSPLVKVRSGVRGFSPLLNLTEDFSGGEIQRFNSIGEISQEKLPLIVEGKLKQTLVSTRTALEYGVAANGAGHDEALRLPSLGEGLLVDSRILKALDTGVYLSNLHYLNWSDQAWGRITGMTRYACFWVEDGEIVCPIENMRWDDSLFRLLGSELEALTHRRTYLPNTGTYEHRHLGGSWVPGALIRQMDFTL